jgi:adhesin transport system outer membrane protein
MVIKMMNFNQKWYFPASVVLGFCISGGVQAQSLNDVVRKAIVNYPSVAAAKSKVEVNRADIDRARAAHYPQLTYGYSRNQYATSGGISNVDENTRTPSFKINLWSGGRIEAEAQRAEAQTRSSELLVASTRDEVALLAAEAYINWTKCLALVSLSKSNLASHQETFDDIRKIVLVDSGRRIDLDQAQVRLDNAGLNLLQRQADLSQAEQRMRRVTQSDLPAKSVGVDSLALPPNGKFGNLPATMAQALASVDDTLPVIAQQLELVSAAQASLRAAQGGYWPTVDLSVSRQVNANLFPSREDTLSQIQLNMPLYTGGSTSAQIKAAVHQLEAQQFALDDVRLQAREKAALTWQDWQNAQARAGQAVRQSSMGDSVVDGYRKQFRLGRRQLLDLLNIQAESYSYQSNSAQAVYDEKVARARLLAATGMLAKRFSE